MFFLGTISNSMEIQMANVDKSLSFSNTADFVFILPAFPKQWLFRYCGLAPTVLAGKIDPGLFEILYVSRKWYFILCTLGKFCMISSFDSGTCTFCRLHSMPSSSVLECRRYGKISRYGLYFLLHLHLAI